MVENHVQGIDIVYSRAEVYQSIRNTTKVGVWKAEGLSGRFVRIDAKRFGKIPGVTDREYYTNSSHKRIVA